MVVVTGAVIVATTGMNGVAAAATEVGEIPTTIPGSICLDDAAFVQAGIAGPPSYTVPAGGGILTSWKHRASPNAATLQLKVFRLVSGQTYKVVAASPIEALDPGQPKSFALNPGLKVAGGDLIGLYIPPGSVIACDFFDANAANSILYGSGNTPTNSDQSFTGPVINYRMNVSALLEPDADGDGAGDETQDKCPTDATTTGACPAGPAVDKSAPVGLASFKASYKLRTALKKGITGEVSSNEAGKITGSGETKLRKRKRASAAKATVVASGSSTLSSAGKVKMTLVFTKSARRKLKKLKRVKLTLRFSVADASGNKSSLVGRATLER